MLLNNDGFVDDNLDVSSKFPEDTSEYDKDNDRFLRYAKQYVVGAIAVETAETGEYELTVDDLYIVWFSKTLQNWKVMISTSIPGDGLYFEVTHKVRKKRPMWIFTRSPQTTYSSTTSIKERNK